jgi:hypothetical protein
MQGKRFPFIYAVLFLLILPAAATAQSERPSEQMPPAAQEISGAPDSLDAVIDRLLLREQVNMTEIRRYAPLVETYIQQLRPDSRKRGLEKDVYFLGKADLAQQVALKPLASSESKKSRGFFRWYVSGIKYNPAGFLEMMFLDRTSFNRQTYRFDYLRREFLGEVRCLVLDVSPLPGHEKGRFRGRIWVEDQDYNIVRFNGVFDRGKSRDIYYHFDSWRLNVAPGKWLPAYIYSEENEGKSGFLSGPKANFRAQVRVWGYNLSRAGRESAFSQILVETREPVRDSSETSTDRSPVEAQRLWERQAEENVIEKLQNLGLLAPAGEVDKVIETVINNLLVTNNLFIEPEVRSRTLLTSALEACAVGNTILISRGLLDVLPDEASLAVIVAQQLGHILAGHQMDTRFAFHDRLIFPDEKALELINFRRTDEQIAEAGAKGMALLDNSPYKNQLEKAGLFMATLEARALELPNLIQPKLGNGVMRPAALQVPSTGVEWDNKEQITALPLGSRIKLDPWTSRVELVRGKPVALISAREKMPFEVTPFVLYLTRYREPQEEDAATESVTKAADAAKKPSPN